MAKQQMPEHHREWKNSDSKNDRIVPERPVPANRVNIQTFDHLPGLNYRPGQRQ